MVNLSKLNYNLSNVNMFLSSGLNYLQDKKGGDNSGAAELNLGQNLLNGAVRNNIAYDMRKTYGSNLGFLVNSAAGYGTPEANAKGTTGMMGASLFTAAMNPWGMGGFGCGMPVFGAMTMPVMTPMMPMGGYFGGGFVSGGFLGGGSFFGGGCYSGPAYTPSMFGTGLCGPSMFGGGFLGHHSRVPHFGRGTFVQNNYYC